jgi:hypothetical protein
MECNSFQLLDLLDTRLASQKPKPFRQSMNLSIRVTAFRGGGVTHTQGFREHAQVLEGGVMIGKLVDALFGCRHARYSFPITIRRATRRSQAAALTGTYVVCLDCGKEFAYDWQEMKVITSPERHRERLAELAKHAASA